MLTYEELEVLADLFILATMLFAFLTLVFLILWLRQRSKRKRSEKDLAKAKERYHELELETLRFQMHPHTFRNTLTSIKHFADKTNRSLDVLTDVLDYVLYDSSSGYVSLKQEEGFLRRFIDFHRVQSDDGREFDLNIELGEGDSLQERRCIAPLITAYFVENAVKHGDLKKAPVKVELMIIDGILNYHVVNAIPDSKKSEGKGGIGHQNLKKRLEMIYPDSYELLFKEQKGFYHAYIKLDLNKAPTND